MADATTDIGGLGLTLTGGQVRARFIKFNVLLGGGENDIRITGFPGSTKIVHAWVTEAEPAADAPKIGTAKFRTNSVQFYQAARECRILFSHDFGNPLPFGVMLMFGAESG